VKARPPGSALIIGMLLLSVVTLLALAAASGAHIELQLARNEQFRENAASAASAGIESAIHRIVSDTLLSSPIDEFGAALPGTTDRFEVRTRFLGYQQPLPQAPGSSLVGAHFEIIATGHSLRGAVDRQRAIVMRIVAADPPVQRLDCQPLTIDPCLVPGELRRLSWQRLPPP
jgi:hypothetical protein